MGSNVGNTKPAATEQRLRTDLQTGQTRPVGPARPVDVVPITREQFWHGDRNAPSNRRQIPRQRGRSKPSR